MGIDVDAPAMYSTGEWTVLRAGVEPDGVSGLLERLRSGSPSAEIALRGSRVEIAWPGPWSDGERAPSVRRLDQTTSWAELAPYVDSDAEIAAYLHSAPYAGRYWPSGVGLPTVGWGPGLVTARRVSESEWRLSIALRVQDKPSFEREVREDGLDFTSAGTTAVSSFILPSTQVARVSSELIEIAFRDPVTSAVERSLLELQQRSVEVFDASEERRFPDRAWPAPPVDGVRRLCAMNSPVPQAAPTGPTWAALSFHVDDPLFYTYQYDSSGSGNEASFTASAFGDLDCDGVYSTFVGFGDAEPSASDRNW